MNSQQQPTQRGALDIGLWRVAEVQFAANVRTLRELRGMSQSELAAHLSEMGLTHVHQTTIKRIEGGIQSPKLGEVLALCFALGVTLDEALVTPEHEFRLEHDRVYVTRYPEGHKDAPRSVVGRMLTSRQREELALDALRQQLDATERYLKDLQSRHAQLIELMHRPGEPRDYDPEQVFEDVFGPKPTRTMDDDG